MNSVKDFGARGDGQTDDTDSIRHAVSTLGGHIVFPRGVYRITSSIDVDLARHRRVSFSGDMGTATLAMHGPGPALRFLGNHAGSADPNSFDPGIWAVERMPCVSDLEILGEHAQAVGIAASGTMQLTVRGVLIRQCLTGIRLHGRNRNVLIADSHIYHGRGPAIGIHFDEVNLHQAIISGCHISYHAHAGIKLEKSEVRNLQITGCDIEYNHDPSAPDSADVWIDSREGTVREGTIASNTIQAKLSPGGSNVRIDGPNRPDSAGAGLWTIAGNILQSQETNLRLHSCRAVAITGNSFASGFSHSARFERCRNISMVGNTFDYNPDYEGDRSDGILIRGGAGITLSGLVLEGIRAGTPESGGAIQVEEASEVLLQACQILDPAVRGIDLKDVRNLRVSDCTILDRRGESSSMLEAIRLRGSAPGTMLSRLLIGGGRTGLRLDTPDAVTVDQLHEVS